MPPPAKTGGAKGRSESRHGVKLPALTPPQSPKKPETLSAAGVSASPRSDHIAAVESEAEAAARSEPTTADVPSPPSEPQETLAAPEAVDAAPTEVATAAQVCGDGAVRLVYQQYDELFPIAGGSTTQAAVDDVYCLSFVMPNCRVHLSRVDDAERFARLERGEPHESVLVREQPLGTFVGLEADQTYFVVVEQEAEQLARDQQAARDLWAPERAKEQLERDDGRGFESCSCIYGNPCVDEYGCRDWHARFAVATANGWKGF